MNRRKSRVDLAKLTLYIGKRAWLVFLCALLGFFGCYVASSLRHRPAYTAAGLLYVNDGNPNIAEHQYASQSDMNAAALLTDTYRAVLKSGRVMDAAAARLQAEHPGITADVIADALTMTAVTDTGVVCIACVTKDGKTSADICNAVLETAPEAWVQALGVGSVRVIDWAAVPSGPDAFSPWRSAVNGGLIGAVAAVALLAALYLLDRRVRDAQELTARYTPPVLGCVALDGTEPSFSGEAMEAYARLRLGLMYALKERNGRAAVITGAAADEGADGLAAHLAVSCARSGIRTLLIDGDLRGGSMGRFFAYGQTLPGLTDVLQGTCPWRDALVEAEGLQILPAGRRADDPPALLSSGKMRKLMEKLSAEYGLILLYAPPVGCCADALALGSCTAGAVWTVKTNVSHYRALYEGLTDAERTGMEVLGFAVIGEKRRGGRSPGRGRTENQDERTG